MEFSFLRGILGKRITIMSSNVLKSSYWYARIAHPSKLEHDMFVKLIHCFRKQAVQLGTS